MAEPASLHIAVERLAARLRSLPHRRLRAGAAAQGLELARWLAREAQLLEFPEDPPRELPDDGVHPVGDQLAVAGHELATAVGEANRLDPERAGRVLDAALVRVRTTAQAVG